MIAMILAAGRGSRMRPLTDTTPKPLLEIQGKPLIQYQLEALKKAGIKDVVINIAHLKEQFYERLGSGKQFGINIEYSPEEPGGLETGGGIINALPLLGEDPFIVISGDLFTDYPFEQLPNSIETLAHIVLVDNPPHNPEGDFCLDNDLVYIGDTNKLNFAGISLYHPKLFESHTPGFYPLGPILKEAINKGEVSGEYYGGKWLNIGEIEQLKG